MLIVVESPADAPAIKPRAIPTDILRPVACSAIKKIAFNPGESPSLALETHYIASSGEEAG